MVGNGGSRAEFTVDWRLEASPVVVVSGDVDAATAPVLAEVLCQALRLALDPVVVDLALVGRLDPAGVQVLAAATEVLGSSGRPGLRVRNAPPAVIGVLREAGLDPLLAAGAPLDTGWTRLPVGDELRWVRREIALLSAARLGRAFDERLGRRLGALHQRERELMRLQGAEDTDHVV